MAAIEDTRVSGGFRKLLEVGCDEVLPGDWVRDRGVFRSVAEVTASVITNSVRLRFEPVAQLADGLTVPLFERVTVWRVCP